MKISLRPHHFLCLQGYKGLNYSSKNALSWSKISATLNQQPDMDVLIVKGNDDLCSNCPANLSKEKARCISQSVNKLDDAIKKILNIEEGKTYRYSILIKTLKNVMTPEKHKSLCSECAWWKKGLCKDSFK